MKTSEVASWPFRQWLITVLTGIFILLGVVAASANPYSVSASSSTNYFGSNISLTSGQTITITTSNRTGDPFLYFHRASDPVTSVASDDDGAGDLNSKIIYTATSSENYRINHKCHSNTPTCSYNVTYSISTPSPPSNTSLPTISGTTTYLQTLTASVGSWTNSPTSYSYQWTRASTVSGTYSNISGATSQTYALTSSDVGQFLRVQVTATNSSGSASATSSSTSAISKANQTITFGSLSNKTLGTGTFTLSATASSGLTVTFAPANAAFCTVSGTTVTLVADGSCTINANQAGNSNYNAASQVQQAFTISPLLSITTPSSGTNANLNTSFSITIVASGGASPRTFALASGSLPAGLTLNTSTGVISGTPTSVGSASITIRVTDANSATSTTSSFSISVSRASRTLSISSLGATSKTYPYSQSLNISTSVSAGIGDLSYGVIDGTASSCSLSSTTSTIPTLTASSSGTCLLTATIAADSNYETATSTAATFTFNKASQTITFDPLLPRTLGMGPYSLDASASSGLPVLFASSNSSICSVADTSLALTLAGTCTITASQTGNTNYDSATAISRSFTISPTLSITTPSSGLIATYGTPYSLSLSSSGGSGGNSFALLSGSLPAGLSLSSSSGQISGTPTAVGSLSLVVRVTDSNTATASTDSLAITVQKAEPLLSSFTLPAKTFGNAPFTFTAPSVTGSIPGSFSYLSDSASVATISGNSVTITGAGSTTLTALFTPTDTNNYETATITSLLTVAKASQSTLTITSTSVPYGQSLSLITSGGSGTGLLSFVVSSGNCSVTTATLTSSSTGSCSVTATKEADTNYLEESTTTTITITTGSATATITFSSTSFTFGITNTITVTTSTAGKVRFEANGRVIKSCTARPTVTSGSITATCNYKPATRRPLTITARLTPTDLGFAERVSTSATFFVARRTGNRS